MFERKVYTPEFKRKAVRLTKERGNIAATARDLGLSDNTLQGWKSQLDKTSNNPFPGSQSGRPPGCRTGPTAAGERSPQRGERNGCA